MKYFSFLVYLVAFIACHDDHHTEPELPQGQWTESHPFKGIPRTGGVSFTIGDVAYVGLGRTLSTATEALKDFWMYKDTTWTRIADFPGTERYGAVAFVLGNIAYVGTGYTPSTKNRADEFHHDFYAYDPSTGKWSDTPVTYLPPDAQGESNARKDAIAFSLNNKAYVGTGISPKNHALKDLYCFDGSTWTELYFPGEARYGASVFVIDDKAVICLGTSGANKTSYLADVNNPGMVCSPPPGKSEIPSGRRRIRPDSAGLCRSFHFGQNGRTNQRIYHDRDGPVSSYLLGIRYSKRSLEESQRSPCSYDKADVCCRLFLKR